MMIDDTFCSRTHLFGTVPYIRSSGDLYCENMIKPRSGTIINFYLDAKSEKRKKNQIKIILLLNLQWEFLERKMWDDSVWKLQW